MSMTSSTSFIAQCEVGGKSFGCVGISRWKLAEQWAYLIFLGIWPRRALDTTIVLARTQGRWPFGGAGIFGVFECSTGSCIAIRLRVDCAVAQEKS